jgi:hypothetical protein
MDARSTMGKRPHGEARKRDEVHGEKGRQFSMLPACLPLFNKQGGSMKKFLIAVALAVAGLALPALSMAQSRRVVVVHQPVHHRPIHHRPVHHRYHHRPVHHRPYHRPPPRHHPAYHPAYHR